MHSHDIDLITAVAEGDLSPSDERAAMIEIESCARCSADLFSQRSALSIIRSAEPPALSPDESTALRISVSEAIGLPISVAATEAGHTRRRIPWPAISMAAVSLAAIIAIVPVMGLLTTASDDSGNDLSVALETASTMQATSDELEMAPEDPMMTDGSPVGTEEFSVETTVVAGGHGEGADDSEAVAEAPVAARSVTIVSIEELQLLLDDRVPEAGQSDDPTCRTEAAELIGKSGLSTQGHIDLDGIPALAFVVFDDDGAIERAVVLSPSDCTAIYATR